VRGTRYFFFAVFCSAGLHFVQTFPARSAATQHLRVDFLTSALLFSQQAELQAGLASFWAAMTGLVQMKIAIARDENK